MTLSSYAFQCDVIVSFHHWPVIDILVFNTGSRSKILVVKQKHGSDLTSCDVIGLDVFLGLIHFRRIFTQ